MAKEFLSPETNGEQDIYQEVSAQVVNGNTEIVKENKHKLLQAVKQIDDIKNGVYQYVEDINDQEEIDRCYAELEKIITDLLPPGYKLREKNDASGLIWRGSHPLELIYLLTNEDNNLILHSDKPNTATRWQSSISYAGEHYKNLIKNQQMPFNIAIGFDDSTVQITDPRDAHTKDAKYYRIANGEVPMKNIKAIAIRMHGKTAGHPFPPKIYKIAKEIEQPMAKAA